MHCCLIIATHPSLEMLHNIVIEDELVDLMLQSRKPLIAHALANDSVI